MKEIFRGYKKKLGSIYFQVEAAICTCFYKFSRIDRKTPVSKSFLNKVADPKLWLSKETLRGRTATSRGVFRSLQNNYSSPFS